MDPFAIALDALFNAPGSEAAEYEPSGGGVGRTPIRIIRTHADRLAKFGGTQVALGTEVIEVRKSEVPTPGEGDTVITADTALILVGAPLSDVEARTWTMAVEHAA